MNTHFNFNQVSNSVFNNGTTTKNFVCPDSCNIGEVVTIGRSKKLKAIFIPSEKLTDDKLCELLANMPEPANDNFAKLIQYVAPIGGYLFTYADL